MNEKSIGIFDSGIGGLTVANSISRLLPNEHLVYYGDSEHMPYGEKSEDLIREFSFKIAKFLIEEKKCKAIVIACNTASAVAYEYLKENYRGTIPIINVIDPMIELLLERSYTKVGLIATKATIASKVYQEKVKRRIPNLNFSAIATPLLASLIEENFSNDEVSNAVIGRYLSHESLKGIDGLVLGCTHYPLISDQIKSFFEDRVDMLLSGDIVAKKLKAILELESLLRTKNREFENEFLVSDLNLNFDKSAMKYYGAKINLKEVKL